MKVLHDFLYLAALTVAATGLITRKHIYINQALDWFGAQTYCRSNYVDLSTIDTTEEVENFKNQTAAYGSQLYWIGLSKKPGETHFTLWSDGSSANTIKWYSGQPDDRDTQHCCVEKSAELIDYFCDKTCYFFCYTCEPKLIVVQEEKTWDEALKHCRTHYTDLISLNSKNDLALFNNVTKDIQTPGFWTGLRFHDGSWYWVNGDALVSLVSLPLCPIQPFVCGALTTGDNVLENKDCKEKKPFACGSIRIKEIHNNNNDHKKKKKSRRDL